MATTSTHPPNPQPQQRQLIMMTSMVTMMASPPDGLVQAFNSRKPHSPSHSFLLLVILLGRGISSSSGTCSSFISSPAPRLPDGYSLVFKKKLFDCSSSTTSTSLSLSQRMLSSSQERYAQSLNMTIEQVEHQKDRHRQASDDLHAVIRRSKDLSGKDKHALICRHHFKHGRHPFTCRNCWSYLPVCVCNLVKEKQQQQQKQQQPPVGLTIGEHQRQQLEVVVWTHHREWGLTSNTGCVLSLTLPNCQLLMKGLPEHDQLLEEKILDNENYLAVVLWPDQSKTKPNVGEQQSPRGDAATTLSSSISLEQVQAEMQSNSRRVVLIAVDGTWRNARRMVARLPSTVRRLDLPEDVVYSYLSDDDDRSSSSSSISSDHQRSSILAPLRSRGESGIGDYNDDASNKSDGNDQDTNCERQVCTAEAVVGALMSLGALNRDQGSHVLGVTRTKVERIFRYRGKASLI